MKRIATLLLALLLVLPGAPGLASQLPDMGDPSSQVLSPMQEREIGRQMMMEVRRRLPLLEDPEVVDYVRDLGARLASHSDQPTLDFEFFVIDDPTINAFAMPGGHIGVNAGLILAARRESELAGVLAHEISHVTQRHIARSVAAAERVSFRTVALLLTALIIGSQDPQAGSAAAMAGMAGSVQQQLNYSRAFEREADALGIRLLGSAGFDPDGMPRFFERLAQATRYSARPPEYLSTHPVTEARIAESEARASQARPKKVFESTGFGLTRAKLVVLKADQPSQAIAEFQAQLRSAGPQTALYARYGLALAHTANREYDKARPLLQELIKKQGEELAYLLALARLERAAGNPERALEYFEQAQSLYPDSYAARYYYAEALLEAGEPNQAYHILNRVMPTREPAAYWLLAKAASEAGLGAEPQLALAEYHYLRGDLGAALAQLHQVLESPGASPHEIARASVRKDELQRELAQLASGG